MLLMPAFHMDATERPKSWLNLCLAPQLCYGDRQPCQIAMSGSHLASEGEGHTFESCGVRQFFRVLVYVTGRVELLQEHHRVVSRSIGRPAMRAGLRSGHSDRWTALDVTRSAFLSTLACYRLRSRRQAPGLTPTACLKTRVRWLWSPVGGQWHAATVRRVQSRLG
jgi:hypothetical protein